MLTRLMIVAGFALTLVSASAAHADRRVALVVGNSAYSNAAGLRNPRNDASDMADTLKKLGFEVELGLDLDQHPARLRKLGKTPRIGPLCALEDAPQLRQGDARDQRGRARRHMQQQRAQPLRAGDGEQARAAPPQGSQGALRERCAPILHLQRAYITALARAGDTPRA